MVRSSISIVLPVYEEQDNIGPCLRGLAGALRGHEHEILVCYDRDDDPTLAAIASMPDRPAEMRLVKNDLGRGAANALRAGFAAAQGDVVVTTMADLSDPPERIVDMAREIRAGNAVVSGSRYMRGGSQHGGPLVKRTLSRAACLSLRWITGIGTHDATTNFRAYARSFLERVAIQSRTSFDIALELTVKAHLAGERVGEVPSTWRDRSHGQSRFRVWAWMPRYLRWYGRAVAAPLAAALAWALLLALAFATLPASADDPSAVAHARSWVTALGLAALGALALARAIRGRTARVDALLPLAWLHPGHAWAWRHGAVWWHVGLAAVASVLVLRFGIAPDRRRAALQFLRARARSLASARGALACLALVWIWLFRFELPSVSGSIDIDPSWRMSYGHFLARGLQAGVDYVFTYGPLGSFQYEEYFGALYWPRVVLWEFGFELALALVFVLAGARIRGRASQVAFFLLLPLALRNGPDTYPLLAIVAASSLLIERERATPLFTAACCGLLALLGMVKFTYLLFGLGGIACAALAFALRRELAAAAGTLALAALGLLSAWTLAGQAPGHLPLYLQRSLDLASGYEEAMSHAPPAQRLALACVVLALVLLLLGARVLERPALARALPGALLLLAGSFLAFKSGFVRKLGEVTFFGFELVAPLLVLPAFAREGGRLARWAPRAARFALVAAAFWGLLSTQDPGGWGAARTLTANAARAFGDDLALLGHLARHAAECERELASARERFRLPHTDAAIGDADIDILAPFQALVLLNDLRWNPRPVFQGYAAVTPELLALNAAHFAGEGAPQFVLFRVPGIEDRLPMMEDSLAREQLFRDYRPVLAENGLALLRRVERASTDPDDARDPPEVLLERTLELNERLDLSAVEGEDLWLRLELERSTYGRIRKFLFQAPRVDLLLTTDSQTYRCRIVPELMRVPVRIAPLLLDQDDFEHWLQGNPPARVRALKVVVAKDGRDCFEPQLRASVLRAPHPAFVPPAAHR